MPGRGSEDNSQESVLCFCLGFWEQNSSLQGLHTDYLYLLTHLDSPGSCLTPRYVYSAASYGGPQNVYSALMTSHSLGLGHALKVFPTGSSMLDGAYPQGPALHRAVPHSGPLGKMSRSEKRIIADHKL